MDDSAICLLVATVVGSVSSMQPVNVRVPQKMRLKLNID